MLENDAELVAERPGQTVIGTHFGRDFERLPASGHLSLLLPVRKSEDRRGGQELFKPLRHVVESVNWPWKGQFDLEEHVAVQTGTSSSGYWSAFSH